MIELSSIWQCGFERHSDNELSGDGRIITAKIKLYLTTLGLHIDTVMSLNRSSVLLHYSVTKWALVNLVSWHWLTRQSQPSI